MGQIRGGRQPHLCSLRNRQVTPHLLRHTMAMELLRAGVDRSVMALWLGHESIKTCPSRLIDPGNYPNPGDGETRARGHHIVWEAGFWCGVLAQES